MPEMNFEPFLNEIIDAVDDGVMIVDENGTIRLANSAMAQLSGFTKEELIGASCTLLECDACELIRGEGEEKWCRLFQRGHVKNKRCTLTRKDGSYIHLLKNASLLEADDRVVGALEIYRDITELEKRDIQIQELNMLLNGDEGFHGMIGRSEVMQNVFQLTEKAARSDATVLITGESGTGKELVARAVHRLGRRKNGPYVKINCAALNESLIESELFGHTKGAFTGALRHRKGLFETAEGGDIFMDEIGDIALSTQVKLLRVLETKQFIRIGDERTIDVDVRFITATNQNLPRRVAEGKFREDLYYRINVFPIHLPPLRERMEDLAPLVNSLIHNLRRTSNKAISGMSPEAMDLFHRHDWPGNIREVRSALEYAFAIADSGLIEVRHLPAQFTRLTDTPSAAPFDGSDPPEKRALLEALRKAGGNQTRAAQLLGVHRMTVFNRMKKYGIHLKKI